MAQHTAAHMGYGVVLRVREFRVLLGALLLSMTGTVLAALALAVVVFERTTSPLLSALTFTLGFAPYLLGGLLLSGLVDRVAPRALMTTCDLLRACLSAAMALPDMPVGALLALLAVSALIAPAFSGAQAALLPEVLGDGDGYVLGRSLLRIVAQTTQVAGWAAGGLLLLALAPRTILLVDALTFVASALLVRLGTRWRPARRRTAARSRGRALRVRWRDAPLRALWADTELRRVLAFFSLLPALSVAPEALAVPYVTALGHPAATAGLLVWALPAGTIAGEVLAARLLSPRSRRRLIAPLAAVVPLAQLWFGLTPALGVCVVLLALSGAGHAYTLGLDAVLLDRIPVALRGQGLALSSGLLMFAQGIGFAAAGAVAEVVTPAAAICATACAALLVVVALRPRDTAGAAI